MGITSRRLAGALAALAATSCASLDPEPSFREVAALVGERTAGDVAWNREDAGAVVDARVQELLAADLTAESAVHVAFLRNRALQAVFSDLGIAQAELVQAGLLANPVLSATVRFGLGPSGTGAELGVVQELVAALQVPLKRRVAQAELEATKLEVGSAAFELASKVRRAFFAVQGAEQMLELRRTASEAVVLSEELARRQHEAGNISDLDLANQRALAEEARLALAEAELDAFEKREGLTSLLGVWGAEAGWHVGRRLPPLPAQAVRSAGLESVAVERRLDLLASRQRIAASAAGVALERFYGLIPGSGIGADAEREVEGGWSVGPALEVGIPLFDWGQARRAMARARQRQREGEFAALAVAIRSDVRRKWGALDAALQRARHYEAVLLPLRTEILRETQLEYNGMLVGVFQLLQAKRDEIDTGAAYVGSLRDYWIARVELERAVGTSLDAPEAPGGAPDPSHSHGRGG